MFHADGQTDVTKLIFAFRNFAKASKKKAACSDVRPSVCDTSSKTKPLIVFSRNPVKKFFTAVVEQARVFMKTNPVTVTRFA